MADMTDPTSLRLAANVWNDICDAGFTPPPGTGEALDEALRETAWWVTTLHAARHDRPSQH
jgi:hypothetical protein